MGGREAWGSGSGLAGGAALRPGLRGRGRLCGGGARCTPAAGGTGDTGTRTGTADTRQARSRPQGHRRFQRINLPQIKTRSAASQIEATAVQRGRAAGSDQNVLGAGDGDELPVSRHRWVTASRTAGRPAPAASRRGSGHALLAGVRGGPAGSPAAGCRPAPAASLASTSCAAPRAHGLR